MRALPCTAGAFAVLLALCAPAAAADDGGPATADEGAEPEASGGRGPLSLAFAGGLMFPRGALEETRSSGLTAGLLLGLTAKSGFGVALSAEYAPLPSAGDMPPAATRESHVGAATLGPRYTLGRGTLRAWVSAGGGVLLDYEAVDLAGADMERELTYEPVGSGALGLEVHAFDSGGLIFMGRYARSFSDPHAELITATGGLVLDF